jgi:hypothetical protein
VLAAIHRWLLSIDSERIRSFGWVWIHFWIVCLAYFLGFMLYASLTEIGQENGSRIFFLCILFCGSAAGALLAQVKPPSACWAWLPPFLWLAFMFLEDLRLLLNMSLKEFASAMWSEYVTGEGTWCGNTECLGSIFAGWPFMASVFYSATAWIVGRSRVAWKAAATPR